MPRARQQRAAAAEEDPEDESEQVPNVMDAEDGASAAAGSASSGRRHQMLEIARSRAEFFARGGGAGTGTVPDANDAEDAAAAAPQQWPGPWSTARDLLRGRDAARAAREAAAPATASSAKTSIILPPDDAIDLSTLPVTWEPVPGWKGRVSASGDAYLAQGDDDAVVRGGGGRVRQPVAVAGPSGVRMSVPPLAVLCMEALIAYLKDVEGVGPLGPQARRQLAIAVCRARAMDNHAFTLFANADADEVHVPDCAGVDEGTMCDAFAACSGLVSLSLQHCGRGFTDRTAAALATSCGSTLQQLALAGAYALTDDGLAHLLQHTPSLRVLDLKNLPLLQGGSWMQQLHVHAPRLTDLHLDACSIAEDVLFGAVAAQAGMKRPAPSSSAAPAPVKKARQVITLDDDNGGGAGEEEAALKAAIELSIQLEASPPSAAPAAAGVFALTGLTDITLAHMPATSVTDKLLLALAQTIAPRLQSFRLVRVPGIRRTTLTALACTFTSTLRVLHLDSLTTLHDDAVYELSRVARGLHDLGLNRCPEVTNTAIVTLLHASCVGAHTISLCGLPGLRDEALVALARVAGESLTSLDVSMTRGFNDDALGQLVDACAQLKRLTVWGCTQLTGRFFMGHVRAAGTDEQQLKLAPLRVYGRPGDVMCAPEYEA